MCLSAWSSVQQHWRSRQQQRHWSRIRSNVKPQSPFCSWVKVFNNGPTSVSEEHYVHSRVQVDVCEIPFVPEILHSQELNVRPTWQPAVSDCRCHLWGGRIKLVEQTLERKLCRNAPKHCSTCKLASGVVKVREASLWLEGHQLIPRPAG